MKSWASPRSRLSLCLSSSVSSHWLGTVPSCHEYRGQHRLCSRQDGWSCSPPSLSERVHSCSSCHAQKVGLYFLSTNLMPCSQVSNNAHLFLLAKMWLSNYPSIGRLEGINLLTYNLSVGLKLYLKVTTTKKRCEGSKLECNAFSSQVLHTTVPQSLRDISS